jgi:ribosome-associated heat shock protein Hsp15
VRLDKWLWAARFFKTRSLAQRAIAAGQVKLNDERVKPAHVLKAGDSVFLKKKDFEWNIKVQALSEKRGPAQVAAKLYQETEASKAERERRSDLRRYGAEPSAVLKGRPTKRDRRTLEKFTRSDEEA